MRTCKTIGALVVACLALAAVASTSSAGEFLLTKGTNLAFKGSFESTASEIVVTNTASGNTIQCPSVLIKGKWTGNKNALLLFLLHKCHAVVGGVVVNCTTAGEPTGLVHSIALGLPVIIILKPSGLSSPGLLVEKHTNQTLLAKFTCGGLVTIEVKGSVVVSITKPNMPGVTSHSLEIAAEAEGSGTGSKQKYESTEEEPTAKFHLESNENGGAFVTMTLNTPAAPSEFEEAGAEGEIHK